ncbi:hypothetical protein PIB30_010189 [Stylosanthes scabra]|uniref:Uncharacterized protein n=1 Tax=Stylosanthes scabra TaxID=79078 RepID=A0ABU6R5U6_9FABA|nr:hypothetical protein [Stylosanthes scabra]
MLDQACVHGPGGFFTRSLRSSGFGGSSTSATSTLAGPTEVDLRDQVCNLTQSYQNQADSAQLRLGNLKAGPNLEFGSCTNMFDDRMVALRESKTLLETDDGKSPELGIRSVSNLGPLCEAGPAS